MPKYKNAQAPIKYPLSTH